MKLYQFEINSGSGPRIIKQNTNSSDAGNHCYLLDHEKNLFLLLHNGRLYYYVDSSGGFGWEACDGEDGPAFCTE